MNVLREPAWFVILYRLSIQYIYTHVLLLVYSLFFLFLVFFNFFSPIYRL